MNMKTIILLSSLSLLFACAAAADEDLSGLTRELEALKKRVAALEEDNGKLKKQIDVERLIVRKELIVSDAGQPWEKDLRPTNSRAVIMPGPSAMASAAFGSAAG